MFSLHSVYIQYIYISLEIKSYFLISKGNIINKIKNVYFAIEITCTIPWFVEVVFYIFINKLEIKLKRKHFRYACLLQMIFIFPFSSTVGL